MQLKIIYLYLDNKDFWIMEPIFFFLVE